MATTSPSKITIDEFLALTDDGVHRELIDGEIREFPMTTRNARHAYSLARISYHLTKWLEEAESVSGVVVAGDARCQLFPDRDTIVGIDVAVFLGDDAIAGVEHGESFLGPPVVAVEVLPLSDTHERVLEKLQMYLDAKTAQVWIVDPDLQTITIHRPDDNPQFFHRDQKLTAEPDLPRFEVLVSEFFQIKRQHTS